MKKILSILLVMMMVMGGFIGLVSLTSENADAAGLADSAWPCFHGNARHTGLSPYDTSGNTGTLKWKYPTGDYVYSSPAIGSDGTIYVGSADNYTYAINPDGTLKWKFQTGGYVDSSPAIGSDGTIYVGSWDSYIYAINPDGTLKWGCQIDQSGYYGVESSPAIGSDGTVYVGSQDDYLYALNPDGTLKWKYQAESDVDSSPAIGSDGTIYVGSADNYTYAINPDGTLKWKYQTGPVVYSSPAIGSDGTIYVGSWDDCLYAINPDGTLKWKYQTGSDVRSSPAIGSDGTIYVGSDDNYIYAINPDGTLKWRYQTGSGVGSSPAIGSDGTIYVGSDAIYAINPDGTLKWKYQTGSGVGSSPAISSDGTVYVGSSYKLYALGGSGDHWPRSYTYLYSITENRYFGIGGSSNSPDGTINIIPDSKSLNLSVYAFDHNPNTGDAPMEGATVTLSVDGGTLAESSGTTDSAGYFNTTYYPPDIKYDAEYTLSVHIHHRWGDLNYNATIKLNYNLPMEVQKTSGDILAHTGEEITIFANITKIGYAPTGASFVDEDLLNVHDMNANYYNKDDSNGYDFYIANYSITGYPSELFKKVSSTFTNNDSNAKVYSYKIVIAQAYYPNIELGPFLVTVLDDGSSEPVMTTSENITASTGGDVALDGATLSIPPDALAENATVTISTVTASEVKTGNLKLASKVYEFNSTASFSSPVTVTISYSESDIPEGVSEEDLAIYTYQNGEWVKVGGTVDTEANTITVELSHFSMYAAMANPEQQSSFSQYLWIFIAIVISIVALLGAVIGLKKRKKPPAVKNSSKEKSPVIYEQEYGDVSRYPRNRVSESPYRPPQQATEDVEDEDLPVF